jgi:hypothetical protein
MSTDMKAPILMSTDQYYIHIHESQTALRSKRARMMKLGFRVRRGPPGRVGGHVAVVQHLSDPTAPPQQYRAHTTIGENRALNIFRQPLYLSAEAPPQCPQARVCVCLL